MLITVTSPVTPLDQVQNILDIFQDELAGFAPAETWQVKGPVGNSRKCDIYILSSSRTNRKLAVKIYRPGVVSAQAPKAQYEALTHAHNVLACPKPYGFHAETGATLMEWVEAPRLVNTLWKKTLASRQRLHLVEQVGTWLRTFHTLSEPKLTPIDVRKLQTKLRAQFGKHETAAAFLHNTPAFTTALKTFEQMELGAGNQMPHVFLHGDFTPSNLLVKDFDIIGIDIWSARNGPIYEDIARMLAYLAVISPFALAGRPLHPENRLLKAFQKGYGADWFQPATQAWQVVLLYQQLRRWLVYQDRVIKGKHPVLSRWFLSRAQKTALQTHSWLEQWHSEA